MARGSYSSARKVCSQATVQPTSSSASRKKVRQKRLRPSWSRDRRRRGPMPSSGLGSVAWELSSASGLGWVVWGPIDGGHGSALQVVPSGTNT